MSLKITYEMAEKHSACGRGLELLKRYPEGFTVDDVYSGKVKDFPMAHIAWTLGAFPYSEEERIKVKEYLKIINCNAYYCSWDIKNCTFVEFSSHCADSVEIGNSSDVSNSTNVSYSTDVNDSSKVYSSHYIYNCAYIWRSSNIENGMNIFHCKNVRDCFGVHDSHDLVDAIYCDNCADGENLMLCRNLVGVKNRILCDANAVGECCIANQEVPKTYFEKVWMRLSEILLNEPYYFTTNLTDPDWSKIAASLVIWTNVFNTKGNSLLDALPSFSNEQKDFLYNLIPSTIFVS